MLRVWKDDVILWETGGVAFPCCQDAGNEIDPNGDLFAQQNVGGGSTTTVTEQRRARQATETPAGVVRTAEEIRRAEEEAQRKKDAEEREAREREEAEAREAERIRKENSTWTKLGRGMKTFFTKLAADED